MSLRMVRLFTFYLCRPQLTRYCTDTSLTFRELSVLSIIAARKLGECIRVQPKAKAVGLLCTSSLEFVLTWLGFTRLGFGVLLLAYVPSREQANITSADKCEARN